MRLVVATGTRVVARAIAHPDARRSGTDGTQMGFAQLLFSSYNDEMMAPGGCVVMSDEQLLCLLAAATVR
jgi:hypothetical protein